MARKTDSMGRGKLKDQNFTQFNFAQTHIDGTGQEKIIGTGMVRESKSDFIGTGSRTYPVPIGQTLNSVVYLGLECTGFLWIGSKSECQGKLESFLPIILAWNGYLNQSKTMPLLLLINVKQISILIYW